VTHLHPAESAELYAHFERAAKARTQGMTLFRDRETNEYFATSQSQPGHLHRVTLASCDCIGFVTYQHCRHHSALVVAHLLAELGTPSPAGTPVLDAAHTTMLGEFVQYTEPANGRTRYACYVGTPDGMRHIANRSTTVAAIKTIRAYVPEGEPGADLVAEDPGVDAFFELINAHAA